MEEYNIKTKVVGVDISNESTTYAIVDVRGNILAEDSFPTQDYPDVNNFVTALSEKVVMLVEGMVAMRPSVLSVSVLPVPVPFPAVSRMPLTCLGRVLCHCQRCCATVWDWL